MTRFILVLACLGLAACTQPGGQATAPAQPSADPTSAAYFQSSVGDRVLFPVNEATLSPAARGTLEAQARWLIDNPSYRALIEGHADEQGTREYNLALGARRAAAVQEFLVARGVADGRVETVTFGKERPLAICSDESCYARNRRAVTVVATGGAGV
ncbi:MAG: peptidoglycan-associated lipoprotein Pal [Mangrovicoccus sp.]|nr:peptidoglycan-associated lipoprotein Pal [Mangrovicoccus sp.]